MHARILIQISDNGIEVLLAEKVCLYQENSRVVPELHQYAQLPHIGEIKYLLQLGTTFQQLQDLIYAAQKIPYLIIICKF